jgi:hypothetical protein
MWANRPSRLTFNQENASSTLAIPAKTSCRQFRANAAARLHLPNVKVAREPLVARRTSRVGCSSTTERRAVNAETTGSTPASRPKSQGAEGLRGRSRHILNVESVSSNLTRPAKPVVPRGCSLVGLKRCTVYAENEGSNPSSLAKS